MRFCSYLVTLLIVVSIGCNNRSGSAKDSRSRPSDSQPANRIYAVSYPLQFLTQQIVGEEIEVLLPYGQADDRRNSRPAREVIEAMQNSDLVIANGVGARYAKWLALVSLPDSKIVNTASKSLSLKDYIQVKGESIVHSHGPEGEHSHPVMAARAWLDPSLAKKQANYIAKRLKVTYPEMADRFQQNLDGLQAKLDELVETKSSVVELAKAKSPVVFTAGSKFEFLTRAAGLSADPLKAFSRSSDLTDDQLLAAVKDQLDQLRGDQLRAQRDRAGQTQGEGESAAAAEKQNPALVFIDQQLRLSDELSAAFLSNQVQPVRVDLLDVAPAQGDYISAMRTNMTRIQDTLKRDN